MLKENSLKGFLQKSGDSGDSDFWYSQIGQSLNLRKKVASQYDVSNAFLLETTTFKKRFPKLECKSSVSYNDS